MSARRGHTIYGKSDFCPAIVCSVLSAPVYRSGTHPRNIASTKETMDSSSSKSILLDSLPLNIMSGTSLPAEDVGSRTSHDEGRGVCLEVLVEAVAVLCAMSKRCNACPVILKPGSLFSPSGQCHVLQHRWQEQVSIRVVEKASDISNLPSRSVRRYIVGVVIKPLPRDCLLSFRSGTEN